MKRWVTADWHLGEDRMSLMQRPFVDQNEMVETLIVKHNALVAVDDEVYVLGDVCYQKHPEYLHLVSRFNGKKILIRGNHDRVISDVEFKKYFCEVIPEGEGMSIEAGEEKIPCYMTHYPAKGVKDKFNLVGHIHSAWRIQLNMFNVGVDANHFAPVDLDVTVPFLLNAITNFYDSDVFVAYDSINSDHLSSRSVKASYSVSPPPPKVRPPKVRTPDSIKRITDVLFVPEDDPITSHICPPFNASVDYASEMKRIFGTVDVHDRHCCKIHGCKYNDEKCTVVSGICEGIECEDCDFDKNS